MKSKKRTVFLKASATEQASLYETQKSKVERENITEDEVDESQGSYDGSLLERNVKLMSPARMVVRRFFRSKLSILGLIMVVGLFLFSFLGPYIYHLAVPATDVGGSGYTSENAKYFDTWWDSRGWQQDEKDTSIKTTYVKNDYTININGQDVVVKQTLEKKISAEAFAKPSKLHPLGTDKSGYDVLSRLMYGGRVSLTVSFLAVFIITAIGVVAGGIAGYFGGVVDNIIMRICDILMCLPGIPILLIVGVLLNGWMSKDILFLNSQTRIYFLMAFISLISWTGTARLVRGQILSLREQEFMVAAEAMGYSTFRKIFKHLIPNVMPQLIVQMTLGLGSMIIYESTLSYLGFGVKAPNTAWGTILNLFEEANGFEIAMANPLIWVPAGLCIVIAVLGFNFVGDGLRDALDPKSRR